MPPDSKRPPTLLRYINVDSMEYSEIAAGTRRHVVRDSSIGCKLEVNGYLLVMSADEPRKTALMTKVTNITRKKINAVTQFQIPTMHAGREIAIIEFTRDY